MIQVLFLQIMFQATLKQNQGDALREKNMCVGSEDRQ